MTEIETEREPSPGAGGALIHRPAAIPRLRWWIAGLLLASTLINYTDRQTLSLLAPVFKQRYRWTNTDYANIVVAFRIAYAIGQTICGRLMDRLGTRRGLTLTVLWYSLASMLMPLARGLYGFMGMRFLLGLGESGNWPGATKAVSEWFPRQERALATAVFDSGSSLGAALAPLIVLPLYFHWGTGAAFVLPGLLGLMWLAAWRAAYQPPDRHARIGPSELRLIVAGRDEPRSPVSGRIRYRDLLKLPQTWGAVAARTLTDPVFFFIADWFPLYLVAKGISLRSSLVVLWIPFAGTDLGNLLGGWFSGYLIRRGVSVGWARKSLIVAGGTGCLALVATVFSNDLGVLTVLFSVACFSYGLFTTIANVLPADLFFPENVASVSGLSGSAASLLTVVVFELAGRLSDARTMMGTHIFDPLMVLSGVMPFVGMLVVLVLVRNSRATTAGMVRGI